MDARFFTPILALVLCAAPSSAFAHAFQNMSIVDVDGEVTIGGGRFRIDLHVPIEGYMEEPMFAEADQLRREGYRKRIIEFFEQGFAVGFTAPPPEWKLQPGTATVTLAQVPHYDEELAASIPSWVGRLEGDIPKNANKLHLKLNADANRAFARIVFVARYGGGALEKVITKDRFTNQVVIPARVNTGEIVWRYIVLGFLHIIPKGLDNVLFVLALFLLSTGLKPLLWQVSAFTLAHSVTLGLAMAEVWQLPGDIVEPVIAASIAYVAVENVFVSELNPWRPTLIFVFGLLHGLGFAGVLGEIGMPADSFFVALLAFNVGVEAGQLAVIGLAFGFLFWIREHRVYRRWVVIPVSGAIALVGAYWTIERIFF